MPAAAPIPPLPGDPKARLGIATGQNLAELCRSNFSRRTVIGMWILMEVVAMATDLAEFLGAAPAADERTTDTPAGGQSGLGIGSLKK